MPIMPRVKGKATKILYNILGIPPNMRKDKTVKSKIKRRLLAQDTRLVR